MHLSVEISRLVAAPSKVEFLTTISRGSLDPQT